jgi:hypothetical protein
MQVHETGILETRRSHPGRSQSQLGLGFQQRLRKQIGPSGCRSLNDYSSKLNFAGIATCRLRWGFLIPINSFKEEPTSMKLKSVLVGLALLGTSAVVSPAMSAMPNGLPKLETLSQVEQVRWVCNPWGRCWWRPNYYGAYAFYPPPRFRPWRWHHRPWHRW